MKPHDLVKVTYDNGVSFFWEVSAVLLGGENVESVIELVPVNQEPSGHGRTLCPAALLYVLSEGGNVAIYSAREPTA